MTTTKKIDQVLYGAHFLYVEVSFPDTRSLLAGELKEKVKKAFSIDGVTVDEQTFWAVYKRAPDRLDQLLARTKAVIKIITPTGEAAKIELDEIEAALTPEENEFRERALSELDYPEINQPEMRDIMRRISALGLTFDHSITTTYKEIQATNRRL